MKRRAESKSGKKDTVAARLNRPFERNEELLRMAWSMSAYVGIDSCSPVYILM